jgi:hypothetical protein
MSIGLILGLSKLGNRAKFGCQNRENFRGKAKKKAKILRKVPFLFQNEGSDLNCYLLTVDLSRNNKK